MADTNNPQGFNVDPTMVAAFNEIKEAVRVTRDYIKETRDMSAQTADNARATVKNFDREKISFIVGLFDEVENKLAEINRFTKKFVHEVRNIKDTKAAKEQIEDMVKAMKDAVASQKSFSAGAGAIRRQIANWEKELGKFGDEVRELTEGEMKDLTMLAERTAKAGKDFSTSIKKSELGKLGDFIRGAGAATRPGYAGQLRERWTSMKDAFQGPRLARMAAGAAEGAEGAEGAAGVAGVIGGVVDAIEGGVAALEVGMEALGGSLGWLVIAVEALIAVFDKYVKQNKEMEAKLGKGGIFTGNAMGAGGTTFGEEDAFQKWRRALNPTGTGVNMLGMSWERNLDIAGAIAQGGYNMQSMIGGGSQGNVRPLTTGVQGLTTGFGPGQFGQFQRMSMGVGRVLGMTDAEGVGEILKMLQQYSQTLDSTEKFLAQIDKDTSAAGISTTKYLKIIDEVSGHFNSMNKEINQTLGMMRELSRTGAVSSEVLKDMMEFLTTEQKPDVGGVADRIYAQSKLSEKDRQAAQDAADQGVKASLDAVRGQVDVIRGAGGTPGVTVPTYNDIQSALNSGNIDAASSMIDRMEAETKRGAMSGAIGQADAQQLDQAIQSMREAVSTAGNIRSKSAYTRAAGEAGGLTSPAMTAAMNLTKVQDAAKQWGLMTSDLISGQVFSGKKADATSVIGFLKQLGEIYHMDPAQARQRFAETMSEQGTNLIAGATMKDQQGNFKDQAKANALAITKELTTKWKNKGVFADMAKRLGMSEKELENISVNGDAASGFLEKNPDMYKSLDSLSTSIIKSAADQYSVDNQQLGLELDKARKIGRQTQSMAEIFGNVFSKWFTKIITWLEYIGNAIGWMVKHINPFYKTQEQMKEARQTDFNKMKDQMSSDLTDIPKKLEEVEKDRLRLENKNKGKNFGDWSSSDKEQYKKLDGIEDHLNSIKMTLTPETEAGTFGSDDELDESKKAMDEYTKTLNDLKGITVDTTAAVAGSAQAAGAGAGQPGHVDNSSTTYNVGSVQQNMDTPNTVGKAGESPKGSPRPRPLDNSGR